MSDYLQIDETPIRYLDNERKGKSHKGYFWVFGNPKGNVCFDWQLGRGRAAAQSILNDFTGTKSAGSADEVSHVLGVGSESLLRSELCSELCVAAFWEPIVEHFAAPLPGAEVAAGVARVPLL